MNSMTEEEKKAIEWLKKAEFFSARLYAPIILNLIDKQQKEIETLKEVDKKICNEELLEKDYVLKNYISKDEIRDKIEKIEELYEKEMKPYQTEFGLNLSLLTKKEKEEKIYKRNSLLIEIETLKELLEEK